MQAVDLGNDVSAPSGLAQVGNFFTGFLETAGNVYDSWTQRNGQNAGTQPTTAQQTAKESKILGLPPQTFWIAAVGVIVVIFGGFIFLGKRGK